VGFRVVVRWSPGRTRPRSADEPPGAGSAASRRPLYAPQVRAPDSTASRSERESPTAGQPAPGRVGHVEEPEPPHGRVSLPALTPVWNGAIERAGGPLQRGKLSRGLTKLNLQRPGLHREEGSSSSCIPPRRVPALSDSAQNADDPHEAGRRGNVSTTTYPAYQRGRPTPAAACRGYPGARARAPGASNLFPRSHAPC